MSKLKMLVNLPGGFFETPELEPFWDRLRATADLTMTSHNTPEEIADDFAGIDAVLMWSWPELDEKMLATAPNLKFAAHLGAEPATTKAELAHGMVLSDAERGWSPAVSELALTLILSTLRRTSDYHANMRTGTEAWVENIPADMNRSERQLTGRRVGIVGLGGIGQRLAELLEPFNVKLLVHDPFIPEEIVDRFNAKNVTVAELCEQSEIVVICAVSTPETENIIGKKELGLMAKNSILVNVSRSHLIDMDALLERLEQPDFSAAIDVFDTEPLEADSPFRSLPNAYLTPHRAGGLMESVERIFTWLVNDYDHFLAGEELEHPKILR